MNTQDDVRSTLPAIRAITRNLGFSLRDAVRVVLSTPSELQAVSEHSADSVVFGVTQAVFTDGRRTDATVIRILAGLPHESFGSTVAHELGHAWLIETGTHPHDKSIEEGLCELISYAWLKKASSPFAMSLREHIANNPDALYGGGFRKVYAAVRSYGIAAVLTALVNTGELPDDHIQMRKP